VHVQVDVDARARLELLAQRGVAAGVVTPPDEAQVDLLGLVGDAAPCQ
jgi:hypothetical protein